VSFVVKGFIKIDNHEGHEGSRRDHLFRAAKLW
jgi:hypothetical protein